MSIVFEPPNRINQKSLEDLQKKINSKINLKKTRDSKEYEDFINKSILFFHELKQNANLFYELQKKLITAANDFGLPKGEIEKFEKMFNEDIKLIEEKAQKSFNEIHSYLNAITEENLSGKILEYQNKKAGDTLHTHSLVQWKERINRSDGLSRSIDAYYINLDKFRTSIEAHKKLIASKTQIQFQAHKKKSLKDLIKPKNTQDQINYLEGLNKYVIRCQEQEGLSFVDGLYIKLRGYQLMLEQIKEQQGDVAKEINEKISGIHEVLKNKKGNEYDFFEVNREAHLKFVEYAQRINDAITNVSSAYKEEILKQIHPVQRTRSGL